MKSLSRKPEEKKKNLTMLETKTKKIWLRIYRNQKKRLRKDSEKQRNMNDQNLLNQKNQKITRRR